jgi:hypothetical protein
LVGTELVEAGAAVMLIEFVADDCDAFFPDEDMACGDWQPVRTQAANNIAAKHVFIKSGRRQNITRQCF